jgi:hypothetical protein
MAKSAEIELKYPKRTLEKRLERRLNSARAAGHLFIMVCSIAPDVPMADVYCVEEDARSVCEYDWQEIY